MYLYVGSSFLEVYFKSEEKFVIGKNSGICDIINDCK